ncbi:MULTISPECIES: hypothetical protein [Dethiosulfovibrio]|uniref:DUF3352 domain-containing protein n=2 Tax=Dethiosulfovibrio TaxID=47054 RepID=A0ABS9EQG0_9BACT|nr:MULTISPECIES: hypothetical protein [Dethiosulfovibrio]MCF4114958.1 hypothetical protein [Dethiosulfovibrio russensis]MCF4143400.1 hypothetical protein [Dethiosulfovibrio marinus]MCF4145994.1 hypothetical protein [Dethiosulfovibrio acidaminovorans]
MRKSILWIGIALSLSVGVVLSFLAGSALDPGVFLCLDEGGFVELHVERSDVAAAWLSEFDITTGGSGFESLLKGHEGVLGRGAFRVSLSGVGIDRSSFHGAVEIADTSRVESVLFSLIPWAEGRGIAVRSLDVTLPENLKPIFSLEGQAGNVSLALWRGGEGSVVLIAEDPYRLATMVCERRDASNRKTEGDDWLRVQIPTNLVVLSGNLSSDERISLEWGLSLDDEKATLSCWSDWADVLLSQERRDELAVMEPVPLHGEGKMAGLMSWTGSFGDMTSKLGGEVREELGPLLGDARFIGLDENDLLDILDGRVSLSLGVDAGGLLGDFPGFCLLLEGISNGLGKRLVDMARPLPLPFGIRRLDLPGWKDGLALDIPVTAVMAYGDDGLAMGLMRPDSLNDSPDVPESLAEAAGKASPHVLALDLRALSNMMDIYRDLARLSGMGSVREITEDVGFLIAPWERLVMEPDGLDRATFFLFRRTYR